MSKQSRQLVNLPDSPGHPLLTLHRRDFHVLMYIILSGAVAVSQLRGRNPFPRAMARGAASIVLRPKAQGNCQGGQFHAEKNTLKKTSSIPIAEF